MRAERLLNLISTLQVRGRATAAELARELDVSERTIYRAFKHELGTSPYDYLLARRLNRVRRVLLGSMPSSGAVTQAAAAAGFDHFSDMARMYKRLFGETPRQTLRRSGKWSI